MCNKMEFCCNGVLRGLDLHDCGACLYSWEGWGTFFCPFERHIIPYLGCGTICPIKFFVYTILETALTGVGRVSMNRSGFLVVLHKKNSVFFPIKRTEGFKLCCRVSSRMRMAFTHMQCLILWTSHTWSCLMLTYSTTIFWEWNVIWFDLHVGSSLLW